MNLFSKKDYWKNQHDRPYSEFLDFKATAAEAKKNGMSVGDWIDSWHTAAGQRTPTQLTVDGMEKCGVFEGNLDRIIEIGPGSGRYLDQVKAKANPQYYEIYETSSEWREWLVKEHHGMITRKCDGRNLTESQTRQAALVQAHRVFPGLPFLTVMSYFHEMNRVTKGGGFIVFDILTESCFTPELVSAWVKDCPWNYTWEPHFMTKEIAVKFFEARESELVGSYLIPLAPAYSEVLIFKKGNVH
jgi:hypothetical protein